MMNRACWCELAWSGRSCLGKEGEGSGETPGWPRDGVTFERMLRARVPFGSSAAWHSLPPSSSGPCDDRGVRGRPSWGE